MANMVSMLEKPGHHSMLAGNHGWAAHSAPRTAPVSAMSSSKASIGCEPGEGRLRRRRGDPLFPDTPTPLNGYRVGGLFGGP